MQVSDNFGPIQQQVTLDANGNGAVSFQATGSNIRLTNIFFNVNTSTNQAVCNIYKGQIAAGNIVFNSNSGSTGARAGGNLDLFDGETCFVVWTGGDAGSTATATFTGGKVPFGEIRPSNLESAEPFAAGDGTIIFPALKSPNYVSGVSGWKLDRVGDVEFNDALIRGELIVGDSTDGFVFIHNDNVTGATIELMPQNPEPTEFPASLYATNLNGPGGGTQGMVRIESPRFTGTSMAQIWVIGEAQDQSSPSSIQFINNQSDQLEIYMQGNLRVTGTFSRPGCLANMGTPSIPTGGAAATTVSVTSIVDDYSMISGGTVVIGKNGVYDVGVIARYAAQAVAAGLRQVTIFVNGIEHMPMWMPSTGMNATPITCQLSTQLDLLVNDVITFRCFQTSGAALSLLSGSRAWVRMVQG